MAADTLLDVAVTWKPDDRTDAPTRVPLTAYRLQLGPGFGFAAARDAVDYLDALGVTECYLSPCLMAGRDSTHGYDISDHALLNPTLGSEGDFRALALALRERNMGLVLDVVPNHMGADPDRNRWWRDVLENGPSSIHAPAFDIDWNPIKRELHGKVLLPILDAQYGEVLERGDLTLRAEDGALSIHIGTRTLPVSPREAVDVLSHDLEHLQGRLGEDAEDLQEYLSILSALHHLPPSSTIVPAERRERHREKEIARQRLARLVERSPDVRAHVEAAVAACNGTPGDPQSFDRLHALLEAQSYRLAYWRTASDEINYRRFFDVNELAGIRMEVPEVFEASHRLLFRFIEEGLVTGLRIDHPDGLFDPVEYTTRLQAHMLRTGDGGSEPILPSAPEGEPDFMSPVRPFYVVLEKILARDERLPLEFAVHGTTTYRFLNLVNNLLVDSSHERSLRRIYRRITGDSESFGDLVYRCKKLIMLSSMASELNVLAEALNDLSEGDRRSRDFTLNGLRKAIVEFVACMPVYRTYVGPRGIGKRDRRVVQTAITRARRRNPAFAASIFDLLREVLLPEPPSQGIDGLRRRDPIGYENRLAFAMKLQQYTGPVHAKGVEDTAFYRHNVLVSLNEVGGDPGVIGVSSHEFHDANQLRQERWPLEMIGTSTHDTKRGEDVRARLHVISEMSDEWRRVVGRCLRVNAAARTRIDGEPAPDRTDEYLFYQTLAGIWPPERRDAPIPTRADDDLVARTTQYMQKAIKEAKVHTSWVSEDAAYETAVRTFVERCLKGSAAAPFLSVFLPFQRKLARLGLFNTLAQTVLKLAAPGVADVYQATELWDLNLVDPDNRRPVDFELRRAMLQEIEPVLASWDRTVRPAAVAEMLEHWEDGRIKLFVIAALLRARRQYRELLLHGAYTPLPGSDPDSDRHLVAFGRHIGDSWLISIVPRFVSQLLDDPFRAPAGPDVWGEFQVRLPEALAARTFVNLITGETVAPLVSDGEAWLQATRVFETCPAAVLRADQ